METKPTKIVVYHCRNLQLFNPGDQKVFVRSRPGLSLVPIPCSGKVEAHHLLATLAGGADGALVLACAESACRYIEGSKRSRKRVDYARYWLQELNIEPARVDFIRLPAADLEALDKTLKEFTAKLKSFVAMPAECGSQAC